MFDNKYPYTDFHELNLDWFLEKFQEYYTQVDSQNQKIATMNDTVQQFTSFVNNYFENLDVQQEINHKLDAMAADGTLLELIQPYYDQIVAAQNQRIETLETTATSLQNQINNIVAPEGDPTLTEVANARIDLDGTVYPTLKSRCDADTEMTLRGLGTVCNITEGYIEKEITSDIEWQTGRYMALNGTIGYDAQFNLSQPISVTEGQTIRSSGGNMRYVTAFYNNIADDTKGASTVNTYVVPSGVDSVRITEYAANTYQYFITVEDYLFEDKHTEEIEAIKTVIKINDETVIIPITDITWTDGRYRDTNGNIAIAPTLRYSSKISVTEGDVLTCVNANVSASSFRFVCAYNGNSAVFADGATNTKRYVVPAGIDGVVVTTYMQYADTDYITLLTQKSNGQIIKDPMGYMMAHADTLNNGENVGIPTTNSKINNVYIVHAKITTLDSFWFDKGDRVTVDATNLTITNSNGTFTIPHGLTIGREVCLIVENETSTDASRIVLESDGNVFEYATPIRFVMDEENARVQSVNSVLTDVSVSWCSRNLNSPIWLFGDSYFSWYDSRWTYYLAKDGYTKCSFLNGFAGQASDTAIISLQNLLKVARPKMVVWCLGMNDPDDGEVNASWLRGYETLVALSHTYNFEIILYLTPTTPTMDNTYKNALIKASGYRYIDIDGAVRVDEQGNWISGALSSDNVHPTIIGAKIIYYKFLADLPELVSMY